MGRESKMQGRTLVQLGNIYAPKMLIHHPED